MKWSKWLENWDMTSLRINLKFLEMEWQPSDPDREAAWDLYVELLTRTTTQPLAGEQGTETAALESVYSLFPITRETLRAHGRECREFSKLAIVVLNQIVRPFTTKWHSASLQGAFENPNIRKTFRAELGGIQSQLRVYTAMLADMASVEDLTTLQEANSGG